MSNASVERFFAARADSRRIFGAVERAVRRAGAAEVRATNSQVAFRRARAFAWAWIPGRYLAGERPPLVLSVALRRRDRSPRWKEVVEPRPGWFMHHLELERAKDVDAEVAGWLAEAWEAAEGGGRRRATAGR
jgi:hypothetical protein